MRAYHVFIQVSVIAQGLLQYLALVAPKLVKVGTVSSAARIPFPSATSVSATLSRSWVI
jgi:hypothetical protein